MDNRNQSQADANNFQNWIFIALASASERSRFVFISFDVDVDLVSLLLQMRFRVFFFYNFFLSLSWREILWFFARLVFLVIAYKQTARELKCVCAHKNIIERKKRCKREMQVKNISNNNN